LKVIDNRDNTRYDKYKLSDKSCEEFRNLLDFYNGLENHTAKIDSGEYDCGKCSKCCRYPYFYLILYKAEFDLIQRYIEENKILIRIRFDEIISRKLDKRVYYRNWVCPLYDYGTHTCSIYPVRPFSCRIYGPYSTEAGQIEGCVYENPVIYEYTDDLPFWNDYCKAIGRYPDIRKGYILPDSMLFRYPTLEFLMTFHFPWSFVRDYQ